MVLTIYFISVFICLVGTVVLLRYEYNRQGALLVLDILMGLMLVLFGITPIINAIMAVVALLLSLMLWITKSGILTKEVIRKGDL